MNPKKFLIICLSLSIFSCLKNENNLRTNPLINIPDTLPNITIPHKTPEPIITVGNGTEESCNTEAIEKAVDSLVKMKKGGTILFSTGGKAVTIPLRQSLMISSPKESLVVIDGSNLITLDGQSKVRIIQCSNHTRLIIANIKLVNGLTDSSGGAILHPWYGSLECYNVIFTNNRCTIIGPEFGGGAVFAGGLTSAIFAGCIFTYNSASNGGAILNRGSNLKIDSCYFQNNIATGDGGGKESGEKGRGGLGGAVYIDGMNYDLAEIFQLRKSTFIGNISHCHGAAVFSYYYKNHRGQQGAVIEMCSFLNNVDSGRLTTSSGTLYHEGAPLKLHSSTFARNITLKHAGAIFLGPDATTEIVNCTFYCNRTESNGGAIFGGKQNITIVNCTFYGNVGSYGPAIYNDVPEAVTIYNTIFCENLPINNQYAYRNCTATYIKGANVFQWPQEKVNGKPDNSCISSAVFIDPLLDTLAPNGGPTLTMAINKNSPVYGICDSCPPTDQRGFKRKKRCDAGAYEYIEP